MQLFPGANAEREKKKMQPPMKAAQNSICVHSKEFYYRVEPADGQA